MVNLANDEGWSPLHFAARQGSAPIAELLLDHGWALPLAFVSRWAAFSHRSPAVAQGGDGRGGDAWLQPAAGRGGAAAVARGGAAAPRYRTLTVRTAMGLPGTNRLAGGGFWREGKEGKRKSGKKIRNSSNLIIRVRGYPLFIRVPCRVP